MQDFDRRIILVINSELEKWQQVNTASHISAYFGKYLQESDTAYFDSGTEFNTADNLSIKPNTQYPIVIKQTSKSAKIHNLYTTCLENTEIETFGFTREMIEATNDEEIRDILINKPLAEVEFLGVGIFGDNEIVNNLTKKFSLYS